MLVFDILGTLLQEYEKIAAGIMRSTDDSKSPQGFELQTCTLLLHNVELTLY